MFTRILAPIDGSQTAKDAVQLALSVARDQKAELIFCHALEIVALIETAQAPAIDPTFAIEEERKLGQSMLDDAVRQASAAGIKASAVLVEDDPIPAVLRTAKEKNADLIVLGTHGRRGFARAIVGSTTEGVLRRATIPVLAVRHKDARVSEG